MFHRGSRGFRRRSMPRLVQHTYKKVLNFAEASFTAGQRAELLITGVDNISPKQTTATDAQCPTGAHVRYFEVQMPITNAVDQTAYINCSIQLSLTNQPTQDPDSVGGAPLRNQVMHQELFSVGFNQNSTHKFKFKIPKVYQRLKEGQEWNLVWSNSNTINRRLQVIYKIYT